MTMTKEDGTREAAAASGPDDRGRDLLAALAGRRSAPLTELAEPGPNSEQLRQILAIAARVPDHGGLEPWRFIVFAGDARQKASAGLAKIYAAENTAMEFDKREKFTRIMARVLTYAPIVVIVVSRGDASARIPVWEQELCAGAVCMNLLNGAHALGFDATWVTGWAAYNRGAQALFGLAETEKVAGIIHIGTAREKPSDRKRPDLDAITTFWQARE